MVVDREQHLRNEVERYIGSEVVLLVESRSLVAAYTRNYSKFYKLRVLGVDDDDFPMDLSGYMSARSLKFGIVHALCFDKNNVINAANSGAKLVLLAREDDRLGDINSTEHLEILKAGIGVIVKKIHPGYSEESILEKLISVIKAK